MIKNKWDPKNFCEKYMKTNLYYPKVTYPSLITEIFVIPQNFFEWNMKENEIITEGNHYETWSKEDLKLTNNSKSFKSLKW